MLLYIDPSSMTYLIQIVAGVVIAAGAGLAFYWKRIKRFFQNRRNPDAKPAPAATDDSDAGETFTSDRIREAADQEEHRSQAI